MAEQIDNFRIKIRNTKKLKRKSLSFGLAESQALINEIEALEEQVDRLKKELLQQQSVSIDIVGKEF